MPNASSTPIALLVTPMSPSEAAQRVSVQAQQDVLSARQQARQLAASLGFGAADQTRLATAISELTRNAIMYAGAGECLLWDDSDAKTLRIRVAVTDQGPGIADLALALRDGYSTSGGLGAGLPGTRRLVDQFSITSDPASGTRVEISLERARVALRRRL